jgi:hypothetical protein
MDFARLLDLPLPLAVIVIIGIPTVWVVVGIWLIRRRWPITELQHNNEVAGFIYAVVGVVYAVVLAFVFIVVWEHFSDTEEVVENEASALASIYREVQVVFPDAQALPVRSHIYIYAKLVADDEWKEMEAGNANGSDKARAEYNAIWDAIRVLNPDTQARANWHTSLLEQLDHVAHNRRVRLTRADPENASPLWLLLLLGGVLTIGYTYLFGVRHVSAQMIMLGILTALISLILFSIFAMERPFRGVFRIPPTSFEREITSFERQMRTQNITFPAVPH